MMISGTLSFKKARLKNGRGLSDETLCHFVHAFIICECLT